MNTIKNYPIPTILEMGRKKFCAEYGKWPNLVIMGDKYFDQLTKWYECELDEIWGMKIQGSSNFDDFELIGD